MLRKSIPGAIGALLHLALLAGTVALIIEEGGSAWPRFWTLFLALDFPVSLGIVPVTWLAPPASGGPLRDASNFWWPLVYHGIVGTGWWYLVGWAIGARIQRWRGGAADGRGS
jgi:hypothetical protein